MTNLAHIAETALLLLAAYLLGCSLGYAARRILHAARGTRQTQPPVVSATVVAAPAAAEPHRARSPAARLAARVDDLPVPNPVAVRSMPKPAAKPRNKPRSADPKPQLLQMPRAGGADNLKQIKGIGPKIEASLYALGVHHLDQIAAWTPTNIDWIDGQLAFKGRIRRERWVEQAVELTRLRASA